jgi:hypothetical protein
VSSCQNDSKVCVLEFPLPLPRPPRKTIHNLPKTPPHQDFLITNAMTQGRCPEQSPSRINCADLGEEFVPGTNKRPPVSIVKKSHLKPFCHRTVTTTVTRPPKTLVECDYGVRGSCCHPETNPTKNNLTSSPHTKRKLRNGDTTDVCPRNGPGLSAHSPQSGGQHPHPSRLPCIGVKRSTRRHNPQSPWIFFLLSLRAPVNST